MWGGARGTKSIHKVQKLVEEKCSGKVESTFTWLKDKFWNVKRKNYLFLQLMKQCINCYIQTEYVLNSDPNAEVL